MIEEKSKSLKINICLNFFRTLSNLIFPLITFPYASRILLPDGIGRANFANSIVSYFSIIAMLGINAYGIREAAKVRDDKEKLSKFVKEIFFINLISTVISYVLFFITIFNFKVFFKYKELLLIYSITILFTTLGMEWLYTAVEDFFYITIRSFIFQGIALILLFFFVKTKEDLFNYAVITVFSNIGSNICNFIHARKFLTKKSLYHLEIKKHIKSLFTLFALALTSSIYTLLDTTMLGLIGNPFEVGIYVAATKINRIVLSLVVSVCSVLLPRLSYFYGNNEKVKFLNTFYKLVEAVFAFSFPCAIGLSVLGEPLIDLFSGKNFMQAVPTMRIMNPIIIIVALSNCIGVQLFMPLGKEQKTLYSDIAGAFVNFLLNIVFIKKFGAVGAAIGSVCAETTVLIIQLIFARKDINLNFILKEFLFYFFISSIMGLIVFFVSHFFQNLFIKISISIFIGIITYSLLLFITKRNFLFSIFYKKHIGVQK